MQASASDAYLTSQVMTATPQKLQLMLIDGAIRFIRQGKRSWESNQDEEAGALLGRGQEVLGELLASVAGSEDEVARKAASVYLYLFRSLTEAQLEHNPEKLDDVLKVLDIERETWQTVCNELGSIQTDQQTSAESHTSDIGQPNKLPDIGAASSILPPIGQANQDSPRSGVSFEA